ncbi:hypothetical protein [Deinococcus kurensis]|uniref:hypothetical protein n=1 Tax=Deinococcus kurensis TaxID=2662757 RepID=UPI0012D2B702|nr:hypothetical protein [Deinococcus kurensis]
MKNNLNRLLTISALLAVSSASAAPLIDFRTWDTEWGVRRAFPQTTRDLYDVRSYAVEGYVAANGYLGSVGTWDAWLIPEVGLRKSFYASATLLVDTPNFSVPLALTLYGSGAVDVKLSVRAGGRFTGR